MSKAKKLPKARRPAKVRKIPRLHLVPDQPNTDIIEMAKELLDLADSGEAQQAIWIIVRKDGSYASAVECTRANAIAWLETVKARIISET